MKKVIGLLAILFTAGTLVAQTAAPKPPDQPKTKEVQVASSVSEDALLAIYKDFADNKDKANTVLQQARAALDAKNKPILDKITPLQKQIDANNQEANTNYGTAVQPFQINLQRDQAQIEAIQKVVKTEQKLPDNATFDLSSGKWTVPDAPVAPAPAKK